MKHKKKWITLKEAKNGVRVKLSTNITGVDVIDMLTMVLCKILIDTAELDVSDNDLAERYKGYMLYYLKKFKRESQDKNTDNTRKTAYFYKKSQENHEILERKQVKA